jgi:hypothetical protein
VTRWQLALIAAVILAGGSFAAGLSCGAHRASNKAQVTQTQSDQHEGAAKAAADTASSLHAQGQAQDTAVQKADASVDAAKRAYRAAVDSLGAARPPEHTRPLLSGNYSKTSNGSTVAGAPPAVPTVAEDATVDALAKADTLIQAQDQEIASLKLQVSIAKAEADQWHTAYNESQKALALEQIAKDAAVRSEARRGWLHTLEGVAVGALAGRLAK